MLSFTPLRFLRCTRMRPSASTGPYSQVKSGRIEVSVATLDPSLSCISPEAHKVLRDKVPDIKHSVVWEYIVALGRRKKFLEEAGMTMDSDGLTPLQKLRNSSGTPFDVVSWNMRFSNECDCALDIAKEVNVIEGALAAQKAASNPEEAAMMAEMAAEDIDSATGKLCDASDALSQLVNHRVDESDEWSKTSDVWTLETLGRAGGVEAGIFARDLLELYKKYCEFRGWQLEDLSDPEQHGGKLRIRGDGIYVVLKHEVGIHRVQRVPVTDAEGKMQTSTASVFLMPQPSAVSVDVKESDCKFDFVRGSGPGGQGMQSSSNACVLTHVPTGYTFKVHQARSALGNKELALEMLAQRMWRDKNAVSASYQESLFERQWSSGERGEKIRTYNYPQNRVTEHRLNKDFPLVGFMEGGASVQEMHDEMVERDRRESLAGVLVSHITSGFSSD